MAQASPTWKQECSEEEERVSFHKSCMLSDVRETLGGRTGSRQREEETMGGIGEEGMSIYRERRRSRGRERRNKEEERKQ